MGGGHATDVSGHPGDAFQLGVPGTVDRVGRQREGGGGEVQEPRGVRLARLSLGLGPVGEGEQLVGEEPARCQEPGQPLLEVRVEEPPVLRHEHRGEDPERVAGQLGAVDRPERGGDDGIGWGWASRRS